MSLMDGLISHWKMDQSSGNAPDSVGGNTLTAVNTPTSATGKINTCASLASGSLQSYNRADNASLSLGGHIHCAMGGWVKLTTKAATMHVIGKRVANIEYWIRYNFATDRLEFMVTHDGTTQKIVSWGSAPSTAVWYYVLGWHDPDADIIAIQINGATPVTTAHSLGTFDGTSMFEIGAGNGAETWNGLIDEVSFWKGRKFTQADGAMLYNNGNGLPLSAFAADTLAIRGASRTDARTLSRNPFERFGYA